MRVRSRSSQRWITWELAPLTVKHSGIATDPVTVDSLVKAKAKLLGIKDESSLADIQVRFDNGNVQPLLLSTTLVQLSELSQQLDPNSGKKKRGEHRHDQSPLTIAIDFGDLDFAYCNREDQVNELLSNKRKKQNIEDAELFGDLVQEINATNGVLLQSFSEFVGNVGMFAVQQVEVAFEFVVQMGTSFSRAVVDTAQAVVVSMELVF